MSPSCSRRAVALRAKFVSSDARPSTCSFCSARVATVWPFWLETSVALAEQVLLMAAFFALLLARLEPLWLLAVAVPLLPRHVVRLAWPLEVITPEREAAAKESRGRLTEMVLIVLALLVVTWLMIGIAG